MYTQGTTSVLNKVERIRAYADIQWVIRHFIFVDQSVSCWNFKCHRQTGHIGTAGGILKSMLLCRFIYSKNYFKISPPLFKKANSHYPSYNKALVVINGLTYDKVICFPRTRVFLSFAGIGWWVHIKRRLPCRHSRYGSIWSMQFPKFVFPTAWFVSS